MIRIHCTGFLGLMLGLISLLSVSAWAVPAEPPFGVYHHAQFSPDITVLESGAERVRLSLNMARLPGDTLLNLSRKLDGLWGEMNPTGTLLPRFTILVALPPGGAPSVSVESWDSVAFRSTPVSFPENNPRPPRVSLGSVGVLGGVRVVPVTFHPLSYVNGNDSCQVLHQAVVRIDIDGTPGENPVSIPPQTFSRAWQKVFQAVVTNWEYIPNFYTTAPSHMLIIAPDYYIPLLAPFVKWKQQRGMQVDVLPTSDIGANPTPLNVRNRIGAFVNTASNRVDYVLLVGDEHVLPVSAIFTNDPPTRFSTETFAGQYTNELYFSAILGTDVFPEVFIGRWVVNSETGVMNNVARVLAYERDTFAVDSLRFQRAAMAADFTENSQHVTKRDVRTVMLARGFTHIDSLWGPGASGSLLIQWVNQGVNFVNYRGSGWADGWAGINFHLPEVESLNNVGRLPIVTGIGCGVGQFDSDFSEPYGFGERWLNMGTPSLPRGAAGFIGPTWNTHTVYNDCLDSTLYRAWLDYDVLELASGLAAGKMMTWELMGKYLSDASVLEVMKTMFRQYLVEGDPSLQVFTKTPLRLDVTLPEALPLAPENLTVTISNLSAVTAESLNVTLWLNDSTFTTLWMKPGQPSLTIPFAAGTEHSVMVTITGDNVLAFQRAVPIASAGAEPERDAVLPQVLTLAQNYPNPFNPETTIDFALPRAAHITLVVFDILGKHVTTLVDADLSAGAHRTVWRGTSGGGLAAPSGIYYCRLQSSDGMITRKMLLVR